MPEVTPGGGDDVAVVDHPLALAHVGAERPQVLDRGVVRDRGRSRRMPASASSIAPVQTLPMRRPAAWRSASALVMTPRRASA